MSRHGTDPLEQKFARSLADFDDALASGRVPPAPEATASDPALLSELIGAIGLLRDLEQIWPRGSTPGRPPAPGDAVPGPARPAGEGSGAESLPKHLGRFRILRRLGGGGGGIVFLAHDPALDRPVALKVPRPEALITPELRGRFLSEARTAAGLDHPNLVTVYEIGEVGPICYIASAYCEGTSLETELRQKSHLESPAASARLVATLADALHHVHGRGILHRDLKPANILLVAAPRDASMPKELRSLGLDYVPKVTDFGLAKLMDDDSGRTRNGVAIGTPKYMAPEQAEGRREDLGPPTDVYALGVILYELLVGRPPFHGDSEVEILHQVVRREPVSPRLLRSDAPRDLEAVCLRCLEKDPRRRYATARHLADDLRRFLAGRPTHARPPGPLGHALKWTRQRPGRAAVAALLSLAVVLGWAGLIWHDEQLQHANCALNAAVERENQMLAEARRQRDRARRDEWLMGRHAFAGQVRLAQEFWEAGNVVRTQELLREAAHRCRDDEPRGFAWEYLWRLSHREIRLLRGHSATVRQVLLSPDGRTLVSRDDNGSLMTWDLDTLEPLASVGDASRPVRLAALSPDGRNVACVERPERAPDGLSVRDVRTGSMRWQCRDYPGSIHEVAFSPKGDALATAGVASDRVAGLRLWDLETGRELPAPEVGLASAGSVAFSPGGRHLAAGTDDGRVRVWDLSGGGPPVGLEGVAGARVLLAYSPDGSVLASGGEDGVVRLWDPTDGRARRGLGGASGRVRSLAFSPDGSLLTAGGWGADAIVWEVATGRRRFRLGGHMGTVEAGVFSPDGRTLATFSDGKTGAPPVNRNPVKLWDLATGVERANSLRHTDDAGCLAFAPDGRTLIMGSADPRIRLWRISPEPEPPSPEGHRAEAWALAFTPDGRTLVSGSDDETARLWDVATGLERVVLRGHAATVSSVAVSPDGRTLAAGDLSDVVRIWHLPSGRPGPVLVGHTDRVRAVAFSPDGTRLASTGSDRTVRLWDPRSGTAVSAFAAHDEVVRALAFSPDGRTLATAGNDRTVRLSDPSTGRERERIGDPAEVWSIAFSPDGGVLAWGNEQGTVTLRDVGSGRTLATLKAHVGGVRALAFAPDGRTLATGGDDRLVKLWEPAAAQFLAVLSGHRHWIHAVAFRPDGHALASASHDGAVKVWWGDAPDLPAPAPPPATGPRAMGPPGDSPR